MSQLRLYDYAASANCYKVRLLLAQLARPYERVGIDIFAGATVTDGYARLNPHRTVPVLEHAPGEYLVESGAILMFLAHGTPLLPDDPVRAAEVVRWLIFEQTDVIPATGGLRFRLQTGRLAPDDPDAVRRRRDGEALLELVDAHLQAREFFVGDDYTIADVCLYGYLHVADEAGYDLSAHPALEAWLERVAAQPGYVNDLEPYPPNAHAGAGRSTYG